jgi:thiosulfate/3-mercaptopyruvate sulfurtransferase
MHGVRPVVQATEIDGLRARARVVIVDARFYLDGRSGRAAFEAGHLPGAVFVDLEEDLSGPASGDTGRHPFPSAEHFAAAMTAAGIDDDTVVVAYDDAGGGIAARLVVMLRMVGRPAALLDGGIRAWTGPLDLGRGTVPEGARAPFTVTPWPADRLVGFDELPTTAVPVLDARSPERFRGEVEPIDPRAGHIPGATNAPFTDNLDPAMGRLRSPDELRRRFADLGVTDASVAICYCGSGVSACANVLALEHAGLGEARLFVPSWSGWVARHG